MKGLKKIQVGYFLTKDLWDSAKELLDYQINDKPNFKVYNTLNFYYFDNVQKKTKKLATQKYYNERIANSLFYGLKDEFYFKKYTIPKAGIGLRNYYFFSYPMQQLVYSMGLYILRISQQFIIDKKKNRKIKSFYGGDLKFDEQTKKLILKKDTTLYYKSYGKFKKELVKTTIDPENKVVIRLDIQNYFDNVRFSKLLDLLNSNLKPSVRKINNFDTSTIAQINFFYKYLGNGTDSIPQSDNNIVSNFISHLYLSFGDLIIEDAIAEIKELNCIVENYEIIRYVDDIYISIEFENKIFDLEQDEKRNRFIYLLLNKISDDFFKMLNLRFNSKADLFRIDIVKEKNRLLDQIKKVSEDYPEADLDNSLSVQDRVRSLLKLVGDLKNKNIHQVHKELIKEERETLKDVYDNSVINLISTEANINKLENKLIDFNFDLLRVYPQPIIILISMCENALKSLEAYLLTKKYLSTFDRELVVILLCQTGFNNSKLINKLKTNNQLNPIIKFIKKKKITYGVTTGFYKVNLSKMTIVINQVSYIEQVRQRVYAEMRKQYSIALNHLLNEIQLICCTLESENINKYEAPKLVRFLNEKNVNNSIITQISNLFDRRNNNQISHPGSDSRVAWAVNEDEYNNYKHSVAKAIEYIFQ